jgi:hypothetical protein
MVTFQGAILNLYSGRNCFGFIGLTTSSDKHLHEKLGCRSARRLFELASSHGGRMRGLLKTNSDALNLVAPSHPDLGRKFPPYAEEQEPLSGVDPLLLIDLLENIDGLKQEVQERMRRTEAVNQAKMLLQEDAIRTESLNRKLAELGRAFGEVRHEPTPSEPRSREADLLRMPPRETVAEIAPRHVEPVTHPREHSEWAHFENRELPPPVDFQFHETTSHAEELESAHRLANALHFDSAAHQVEEASPLEMDQTIVEAGASFHPEAAENKESYRNTAQRFTDASLQKDESIHAVSQARVSYDNAVSQMEQVRQAWIEANEALHNSKQLIEQSTAQLNLSRSKEETAMADLKSAQQDLTTAYQFAAVAAQRQHDAAEFFRKTNRWTINAVSTSWMLLTWVTWLQFRTFVPIWGPGAVSVVIVVLTILIIKWSNRRE